MTLPPADARNQGTAPPGRRRGGPGLALLGLALLPLASCAYDPAMMGAHPAPQYETDLQACRTTSREQVRLQNAKTLASWLTSPIHGPGMVRAAVRGCLEARGYAAAR